MVENNAIRVQLVVTAGIFIQLRQEQKSYVNNWSSLNFDVKQDVFVKH